MMKQVYDGDPDDGDGDDDDGGSDGDGSPQAHPDPIEHEDEVQPNRKDSRLIQLIKKHTQGDLSVDSADNRR